MRATEQPSASANQPRLDLSRRRLHHSDLDDATFDRSAAALDNPAFR
jgi:hypothetical protein